MGYRVSYCEVVEDLSLTHRLTALARREERERDKERVNTYYIIHYFIIS